MSSVTSTFAWLARTQAGGTRGFATRWATLGHQLARTTVQSILKEHGIDPAPERSMRTSWNVFLRARWRAIAACDFFTVEVLTLAGHTRYYVMFVIALQSRRVEIADIIRQPHGAWMLQVARNLTDPEDGFLQGMRFLILDRDPLYTSAFRDLLTATGVTSVRLPARGPNECLGRLVLLGENHLRSAVHEYVAHYHTERNHQSLEDRLIEPPAIASGSDRSSAASASAGSCASTTGRRPEHSAGGSGSIA